MKKEVKGKHFVKKPVYPGGIKAIRQFVKSNLKYPEEALTNRTEGTVHIRYDIDYKGNVVDTKVISGIGYGCDEEAERIVKMLKFNVEKNRGVRVLFHKNIQIHFQLPPDTRQNNSTLQYIITAKSSAAPEKSSGAKPNSYTYTISSNPR